MYDEVCGKELWRVLHECEVDGYLIRSIGSLYEGSRVCVRLGSRVGEYFELQRGLREGCVISPKFSHNFFDRVVRQVNGRSSCEKMRLSGEEIREVDKLHYFITWYGRGSGS